MVDASEVDCSAPQTPVVLAVFGEPMVESL
jgi:hypothetical protein